MNTTTTDIHNTQYTQNLQTYKQHLDKLLTTHQPQDTTLTFDELLTITTNDQQELLTHNTHTNTHTKPHTNTQTHKITPLRNYINKYYI